MATESLKKLFDKVDFDTLLLNEEPTTTRTTKTLYGGRKISDYELLIFLVVRGSAPQGVRATQIVPRSIFANSGYGWVSMTEVDSANTQRWYEVSMVSDTQVQIQRSSNASGSNIFMYGIKLS